MNGLGDRPRRKRMNGLIDGETRAGVDHLVPRVAVGLLGETDGRLGPGEDHHAVGRGGDPASLAEVVGHRLAQRQDPLGVAVVGVVQVDLPLHLVLDELRDGKVRLAQVALDHPLALLLEQTDVRPDLEGISISMSPTRWRAVPRPTPFQSRPVPVIGCRPAPSYTPAAGFPLLRARRIMLTSRSADRDFMAVMSAPA